MNHTFELFEAWPLTSRSSCRDLNKSARLRRVGSRNKVIFIVTLRLLATNLLCFMACQMLLTEVLRLVNGLFVKLEVCQMTCPES